MSRVIGRGLRERLTGRAKERYTIRTAEELFERGITQFRTHEMMNFCWDTWRGRRVAA